VILVKNLVGGRTYYLRVYAHSLKSYESSDEVKFPVPARVKHKAITAGVVGGILFFIVAIILSVCAVKICNKRKRRKQEKGFASSRKKASSPLNFFLISQPFLLHITWWRAEPQTRGMEVKQLAKCL
jgi:hypothetical protein